MGLKSIVSKHRGKQSNNQLKDEVKKKVLKLIKERYPDFGPTFAHEKLTEQHELNLSVESTRQIMMQAGIWRGKQRKVIQVHPQRPRRSCLGELVQIDGSPHDWFEGRRGKCCLLVFIDDATSRLMQLHFAEEESTQAYFDGTQAYLKQHGRPLSFYSDRHSIFRVNIQEAERGNGETQFSRTMRELGIGLICANSPQAKGRVEKANGTLQDRLVKEMRSRGISDIPTANAFLPEFMEEYNKRFAVVSANSTDAHREGLPDEGTLKLIFSHQCQRKISKNLEVSYKNIIYQIQSGTPSYTMRGAHLTVCDRQGEIGLVYKGKSLPFEVFDKKNQPTEVVSSKQLNSPRKVSPTTPKPKGNHPWRNYPKQLGQEGQRAMMIG